MAALLEIVYRYRVNADSLLTGFPDASLNLAAFLGALFAASVSDYVNRGRKHFIAGNFLVLGLMVAYRILGQYFSFYPERTTGPGLSDPNILALVHLAILFPLLRSTNLTRKETFSLVLLLVLIPLYSLSRTALVGVFLLMVLGFPKSLRVRSVTRVMACGLLLVGLVVGGSVLENFDHRLDAVGAVGKRLLYARLGVETILEEFSFFGVPDNEHLKVYQLNLRPQPSYHNTYLSLVAAAGVPGIIGLMVVYAALVRRYRARDLLGAVVVLNLLFLTTGGLIGVGYPVLLGARDPDSGP